MLLPLLGTRTPDAAIPWCFNCFFRGYGQNVRVWTRCPNASEPLSDILDKPDGFALPGKRCLWKPATMREQ